MTTTKTLRAAVILALFIASLSPAHALDVARVIAACSADFMRLCSEAEKDKAINGTKAQGKTAGKACLKRERANLGDACRAELAPIRMRTFHRAKKRR